jgi:hypothetical protein
MVSAYVVVLFPNRFEEDHRSRFFFSLPPFLNLSRDVCLLSILSVTYSIVSRISLQKYPINIGLL